MTEITQQLLIGAGGWLHSAWEGTFYPEDLPADWRLAYYANEFAMVLLGAREWAQISDLAALTEGVGDLGFVCEVPMPAAEYGVEGVLTSYLEKIRQLKTQCLGVVYRFSGQQSPSEALLATIRSAHDPALPLCVDFGATPDEATLCLLKEQNIACCWRPETGAPHWLAGQMILAKISSKDMPLKELRTVLETCLAAAMENQAALLVMEGDPPDVELMRNAKLMVELL